MAIGDRHAQNLREAPAQIAATLGREARSARDQIVMLLDTRLATGSVYPRTTPVQEMGPKPPSPSI